MKSIEGEEFRWGFLTRWAEHRGGDVQDREVGIILRQCFDLPVRAIHFGPAIPAPRGGLDGDEVDGQSRLGGPQLGHELLEVSGDVLRRLARALGEVVVAGVDHHGLRRIGEDDSVRVVEHVRHVGAPEAAFNRGQGSHVGFQGVPEADTGAAHEDDPAGLGGAFSVTFLEGDNRRLKKGWVEACGLVLGDGEWQTDVRQRGENQKANQCSFHGVPLLG